MSNIDNSASWSVCLINMEIETSVWNIFVVITGLSKANIGFIILFNRNLI